MRREFHVRFSEGPGVQFPRATRLVMGFSREADARRVMEVLSKRFEKYGLTLHPEKTRLVEFTKPPQRPPSMGRAGDREHSTSWVSRTTGIAPGKEAGWCDGARPRIDSVGRSRA